MNDEQRVTVLDGDSDRNRRNDQRYVFIAEAEVFFDSQLGAAVRARTTDLSMRGCYIDTNSPSPVGTRIRLRLSTKNAVLDVPATVVTAQQGMGMGVRFDDVQPEQWNVLESWVENLRKGLPADTDRPVQQESAPARPTTGEMDERTYVLAELVIVLIRKHVLTDAEGMELIRKLHGWPTEPLPPV